MGALRRFSLDRVVEVALAGTIFLFACGSSSIQPVFRFGGPARWVGLAVFGAAAGAHALLGGRRPERLPRAWGLAAAFIGFSLLSAAWSVNPRLTVERTGTLAFLLLAAAATAVGALGRESGLATAFRGILGGGTTVAIAGLVALAAAPNDAIQQADAGSGWRFRGFGENPNTASMLYAVALPLSVWLVMDPGRRARAIGWALTLLFVGSIAVSGSRGALGAGFAGTILVALILPRTRPARLGLTLAVLAFFVVAVVVSELPKPKPAIAAVSATHRAPARTTRGIDLQTVLRLEDEIGRPPGGRYEPSQRRSFLSFGARGQGWGIGIHLGEKRPVVGYGFGTEDHVFVDRSAIFEGGLPESSYVGVFMQLGLVGLALFVSLLAAFAVDALGVLRDTARERLGQGAAGAAVLVVAVVLGIGQSSLYSVGNIATASIWVCVFALPTLRVREGRT